MGLLDEAIREHLELKRLRGADPGEIARLEREALGPVRRPEPAAEAPSDELEGLRGYEHEPYDEPAHPSGHALDEPAGAEAYFDSAHETLEGGATRWRSEGREHGAEPGEDLPPATRRAPDDHSIAPSTYGQETAEFDIESIVREDRRPAGATPVEESSSRAEAQTQFHPPPESGETHLHDEPAAQSETSSEGHAPPPPQTVGPLEAAEAATGHAAPPDEPEPHASPAHELEPADIEPGATHEVAANGGEHPAHGAEHPAQAQPEEGEDVLEETPDFLQETPEHERLWFEQRPPRDFDFDK